MLYAQILGVGDLAKVDKKTNALNLERQKRLVECINRDKFMLLGDVHKFFQAHPCQPDCCSSLSGRSDSCCLQVQ